VLAVKRNGNGKCRYLAMGETMRKTCEEIKQYTARLEKYQLTAELEEKGANKRRSVSI